MKIRSARNRASVLMACALMAGCGAFTKTAYTRPSLELPARWHVPDRIAETPAVDDNWWRAFGDPQLNTLVERALRGNQDLSVAVANVERAQQELKLTSANMLPFFDLSGNTTTTRTLKAPKYTSHGSGVAASVSYEVDLWGTLAEQTDAARWEAQATEEDRQTVKLEVVANVIDAYWQLALLSQELDQNNQTIAYEQRSMAIAQEKFRDGAISAIDRLAVEQSLALQQANRMSLLNEQDGTENAMALLMGSPPGEHFAVSAESINHELPPVAAGLPADVLARRPDLKAAEMRLRETLDDVDSTRTSFYPTLMLTGSAGSSSTALLNVLQNPVGTLEAAVATPLLNWRSVSAAVGSAQSTYDAAAFTFRKTFYQALEDVENALAARRWYSEQVAYIATALAAAKASEQRYQYDYDAGSIPLQTLLDAQEARRNLKVQLVQLRYLLFMNQVALYQALGGNDVN